VGTFQTMGRTPLPPSGTPRHAADHIRLLSHSDTVALPFFHIPTADNPQAVIAAAGREFMARGCGRVGLQQKALEEDEMGKGRSQDCKWSWSSRGGAHRGPGRRGFGRAFFFLPSRAVRRGEKKNRMNHFLCNQWQLQVIYPQLHGKAQNTY
jgi:hypothetical protein